MSDADFHAATALALGQVLGEIASLVGLNPDDGELYPIVDRVRRLGAERQQWVREAFRLAGRDGWSSFGTHADGRGAELEFDGEDAAGMPLWERPKVEPPLGVRLMREGMERSQAGGGAAPCGPGEVVGAKDVLTQAMQRHLVELLGAPHWHPESPGEWSTARALERRGYLRANVSQGHQPYSLTDKGREAAQALNSAAGASRTGTEEAVRRLTARVSTTWMTWPASSVWISPTRGRPAMADEILTGPALLGQAAVRARTLLSPVDDVMWWYFAAFKPGTADGQQAQAERAAALLALPAPAVNRKQLIELLATNALRRYESQYEAGHLTWRDFATEAAEDVDALVAAGWVPAEPLLEGPCPACGATRARMADRQHKEATDATP